MHIPMVVFKENSGLFYDNNIPGIPHSLHTCTPATSCPNDTSQGSHLIPTQDLGWAPQKDAQESPNWDAIRPFPSFPPALAEHSRADSPAPTQGLCSAPTRENPTARSFSPCRHPQKSDARPSRHKSTAQKPSGSPLLPAPPLIPTEISPQNSCCVGPGRCWSQVTGPRSHTQLGNLGLGQVLCLRMAESSEIVS